MNLEDEAHELFVLAQIRGNEGIEDAVERIVEKLIGLIEVRSYNEEN